MKVGGQAVMEGVLMRSPNFWGMAVRTPAGDMDVQAEPFHSVTRKSKLFRLPVIRGFLSLAETLWLGMKALTISTNIALGEEEELSKKEIAITMILGLGLAFLLFLAVPVWGTNGLGWLFAEDGEIQNHLLFNLVEGALRIAIFAAYLLIITAVSKDIRRFFAYHGAEHKAIKVYENGEELVPENARKLDTSHVRCGTSFVLYVLVLSILVFSLLPIDWWVAALASRVLVIPIVVGIGFEFIMWSARNQGNSIVKAMIWPGLQLQKLTTREPTDDQVEVAMASLKTVLDKENEASIAPDASSKLVI